MAKIPKKQTKTETKNKKRNLNSSLSTQVHAAKSLEILFLSNPCSTFAGGCYCECGLRWARSRGQKKIPPLPPRSIWRWCLWFKSSWHLPLALVQGLKSCWSCSISQDDDVSRDDIITFRAFPWQGPMWLVLRKTGVECLELRKGGWSGPLPGVRDTKEEA